MALVKLCGEARHKARPTRRLRAQGEEADRVAIADVVLRTDGALDETRWERLSAERPPL